MRNLILHQTNLFTLIQSEPIGFYIDEFSKVVVVLNKMLQIQIFKYDDMFSNFREENTIELEMLLYKDHDTLNDLKTHSIKFFHFKNEEDTIHIILSNGKYIVVNTNEKYETMQMFNEEVLSAEISPNLDRIAVALGNFKLMLLNYDFGL
jgi:hypothetical protein